MQALVIDRSKKRLRLERRAIPLCGDDEVLVKMIASGVCGTDISVINGKITGKDGAVNGHEGLGEVHEIGKNVGQRLEVGTRVVIQPNLSCKVCADCIKYKGINDNFCEKHSTYGIHHDGTMSEFAVFLPEETYDLVIDCTGQAPCLAEAVQKTAKGGTVVLFGCCAENEAVSLVPHSMWEKEIRVITSYIYDTGQEFNRAIQHAWEMEQKGLLNLEDFQVKTCSYEDIDHNWQLLAQKLVPKLVVVSPVFSKTENGSHVS